MRHKDIIIQPFGTIVKVAIGKSVESVLKEWDEQLTPKHNLGEKAGILDDACVLTCYEDNGASYYGLVLTEKCSVEIIIHEIFHLVMNIADYNGAKWSSESDEWYAYCLSNTYQQVNNFIKNKK